MSTITMDYLFNHKFERTGLEENVEKKIRKSGMFSKAALGCLPRSDEYRIDEFKIRIIEIVHDKFNSFTKCSLTCNLKYETLRKYKRPEYKQTLSDVMLAKFVIGCELSLEEAKELFELKGHALLPEKILLDAVIVHCLENHNDLDEFFATCKQVGLDIKYEE